MNVRRLGLIVLTVVVSLGGLSGLGSLVTAQEATPAGSGAAGFRANAARTGFVDEPGPKGPPAVLWRAEISYAQTISAANDVIAVHGSLGVSLFDASTGELRWHADQDASGSAPVIAGDAVYVGSANGFRAYDLATGALRWDYRNGLPGGADWPPIDLYDSSPAYVDGTIYVGSGPYPHTGVSALDAATGTLKWRFDTHGAAPGSPAVAAGLVYIGSEIRFGLPLDETAPPRLYAIDAATGKQVWAAEFAATDTVASTPAVSDGIVIVGVSHPDQGTGTWRAFDAKTGAEAWSFDTAGGLFGVGAAIAEGVAFLTNPDASEVVAVDLQTGDEVWRHNTGVGAYNSLTISRDAVYVPTGSGLLLALDRTTGDELWSMDFFVDGNSVSLAGGKLFLERSGTLFALTDADDPRAKALAKAPGPPTEGPAAEPATFPAARSTHYGEDPGGFWIVEPVTAEGSDTPVTTAPLPVILYLSGCCGNGNYPTPEEVVGWTSHLAKSGYIVIAPVYTFTDGMATATEQIKRAMAELEQPGHATPDYDRYGIVGYSFGGPMTVNFTGQATELGLPVPKAIFLDAPCEHSATEYCVPLGDTLAIPPDLKALVLVFSDDIIVGDVAAKVLWHALDSLPAENRDFLTLSTDNHGYPTIHAIHETTFAQNDAANWYGLWKLSTALFDCTFNGDSCEYALGNTPEQTFMGTWSDGTPVTPLQVTDNPK